MILSTIALIILGIQLIFIALLLFSFLRKRDSSVAQEQSPVSVIVCAHDEEENLRTLIPQLLSQDYPTFEVIIVDDRSNDGLYDFLLEATKENEKLKMVHVSQKPQHVNGKKFALTLGIKAARYDWVLLTDADCVPSGKNWISRMMEKTQKSTEIVLGFSPYTKSAGLLNAFIRFESFLTGIQFIGFALLGRPYMGVGRNLAYRKNLFLDHKGFNSHLNVTGGDDDLFVNQHATNKNTTVSIGAEAIVFSKPKTTWGEFLHQKLRHLSVGRHYKLSDKIVLGTFSLSWMLSWFLILPGLFFTPWIFVVASIFFVRLLLLAMLMHFGSRKLGDEFAAWQTPLLDFMYAFYYLVTGAKALFVKKVQWKN